MSSQRIAIAVVLHQGRVLVGPRTAGQPLAGYWEFPGGKVAPGEAPASAAHRECLEETGIAVRIGSLLMTVDHVYDHAPVALHFFAASPSPGQGDPKPSFQWVPVEVLGSMRFPPANDAILERLRQGPSE